MVVYFMTQFFLAETSSVVSLVGCKPRASSICGSIDISGKRTAWTHLVPVNVWPRLLGLHVSVPFPLSRALRILCFFCGVFGACMPPLFLFVAFYDR